MSLKAFHMFFVAISILMCLSLGIWGVRNMAVEPGAHTLVMGVLGFAGALVLGVYGVWAYKKLKRFSYV